MSNALYPSSRTFPSSTRARKLPPKDCLPLALPEPPPPPRATHRISYSRVQRRMPLISFPLRPWDTLRSNRILNYPARIEIADGPGDIYTYAHVHDEYLSPRFSYVLPIPASPGRGYLRYPHLRKRTLNIMYTYTHMAPAGGGTLDGGEILSRS